MEREKINRQIADAARTVFSYCLARTDTREEAEDLSQDILLELLRSACNLRNERSFYAFMWSVANNVYKNWRRKKARRECDELDRDMPDDGPSPEELAADSEAINLLRRELSLLSEKYRAAAVLYYTEELPVSRIAKRLSVSESMVKYLLFKARKILKEGIGMDREFGEKSYNPGNFEYRVIFHGMANDEYQNLFQRKIPGNILLSAYYAPMTVRELSVELGISSVYMEDELALLERYGLVKYIGECRVQTNLVIFTADYVREQLRMLDKKHTAEIGEVIGAIKAALPRIRNIGFRGADLPENNLLWTLYMLTIFNASWLLGINREGHSKEIYCGAKGTVYGVSYEDADRPYRCNSFAGRGGIDCENGECAYTYANFDVLGYDLKKNYRDTHQTLKASRTDRAAARFPVFEHKGGVSDIANLPDDEYGRTVSLLRPAIERMERLFDAICEDSAAIMLAHAPKHVAGSVRPVINNTLIFELMGWFGAAAINSGALEKPEADDVVSMCGYIG